jgi:hypothetical protein
MGAAEKIALAIVAVGMATALLLPNRQTVPVIGAIQKLFSGSLDTAIRG